MKKFIGWAEENKKELPVFVLDEKTKRAGIAAWAYPEGYVSSQYPDGYFMPIAADALFKMNSKGKKS